MKTYQILLGAAFASTLALSALAALPEPTPKTLGAEKTTVRFIEIVIKNHQDESLGRIVDLGVDLVNGRIVEVLVMSDSSLGVDGKIVAVPPLALIPDPSGKVYRLNATTELFKSAAAIDVTKWTEAGRSDRVAAAYHLFGQETYFLEEGDVAGPERRPKVSLGYVERVNKLVDMPVGNFQGKEFGKVYTLTMDIPRGRILNVIVLAPGNFQTKSVIPAMALSFNEARDALLLDDTVEEFADEPRYITTEAAYGNEASAHQENYKGPQTAGPLEQGASYHDIDRTVSISRAIRTAKINNRHVEIGTINGRVTLRGWTYNAEDKARIMGIAVAASRVELVDDQMTVGRPVASK